MVDRYAKVVLTIIAVCMVWNILVGSTGREAAAQSGPTHVVIDAWGAYAATMPIEVSVRN